MASVVRALAEGFHVGDFFNGEEWLHSIGRAEPWPAPENLASIPLATPKNGVAPVREWLASSAPPVPKISAASTVAERLHVGLSRPRTRPFRRP